MSHVDLEQGTYEHRRRSFAASDVSAGEDSVCFSDAEDAGSCYSHFYCTTAGSYDEYSFSYISEEEIDPCGGGGATESRRASSASDYSVELEAQRGVPEVKVHLDKLVRDCRICHLGLESHSLESGVPIQLGCSCKDDLGAAHKQCAETWFKIKGNKTCEICHSVARNVAGATEVETVEEHNETGHATSAVSASSSHVETRSFWQGHRFLNFLLACMVFAFVISWLFHFNVSSS